MGSYVVGQVILVINPIHAIKNNADTGDADLRIQSEPRLITLSKNKYGSTGWLPVMGKQPRCCPVEGHHCQMSVAFGKEVSALSPSWVCAPELSDDALSAWGVDSARWQEGEGRRGGERGTCSVLPASQRPRPIVPVASGPPSLLWVGRNPRKVRQSAFAFQLSKVPFLLWDRLKWTKGVLCPSQKPKIK